MRESERQWHFPLDFCLLVLGLRAPSIMVQRQLIVFDFDWYESCVRYIDILLTILRF